MGYQLQCRRTTLVSASRDGTSRIWSVPDGQLLATLQANSGRVVSAAFSPNGRRVATATQVGSVQLWDVASARPLVTPTGPCNGERVDSVVFTPDGRQLVVRGDLTVRIYALPIDDLLSLMSARLTRTWTVGECQQCLHTDSCPPDPRPPAEVPKPAQPEQPQTPIRNPGPVRAPIPGVPNATDVLRIPKVVSSLPRNGFQKSATDAIVNAFKMALEEHDYRAGDLDVVYEDMDDANPVTSVWEAQAEVVNANRALSDPS